MYLGLANTLARPDGDHTVCHVTLHVAYWVDNRTGMDLVFKDMPSNASRSSLPLWLQGVCHCPLSASMVSSHCLHISVIACCDVG